jgi:hypothetical protein
MDLDAQELTNCLVEHATAIEEMVKKTPSRACEIVQEFKERCKNKLGLTKPSRKNLLFRLLRSFRPLGSLL